MSAEFNWNKLPPDLRLGSSPDELITLYRGFAPHQLNPELGMLSAATVTGNHSVVEAAVQAVEENDIDTFIGLIAQHAINSHNQSGLPTPFVSATPDKAVAGNYARQPDEKIATLRIPAKKLTIVPLLRYEALVLGSISLDAIVDIKTPEQSAKNTYKTSVISEIGLRPVKKYMKFASFAYPELSPATDFTKW